VIRWIVVIVIALVLFNGLMPYLQRIGLGKLPGDLRFRVGGRDWYLPIATSIILSLIASVIAKFI
jgi:hypothetical protein